TFFLDANNAWVASSLQPGSDTPDFSVHVYRTSDGGKNWNNAGVVAAGQGWPSSMSFVDASHGWLFMNLGGAAGSQGVAFYGTADGGRTWTKLSEADTSGSSGHLPLSCSKGAPVFLNPSTGWLPGSCSAGGGPFFYVTRDGGRTWHNVALGSPAGWGSTCMCEVTSLRFSDARNGVFVLTSYGSAGVPESAVYSTTDGGGSWRPGPSLPAQAYDVYFIDNSHGWTINPKANNSLLSTSDGGQHWSTVGPIPSTQGVTGLQFVTTEIGWASGSEPAGNTLIKTTDGGPRARLARRAHRRGPRGGRWRRRGTPRDTGSRRWRRATCSSDRGRAPPASRGRPRDRRTGSSAIGPYTRQGTPSRDSPLRDGRDSSGEGRLEGRGRLGR
ncbi:MAG: hypothetical protein E6J16_11505, partial [Chloroflexota bacterium]